MYFRLLGPFEAYADGRPVLVGSRRQERCLLGVLLLEAGHVVSTERLMDLLWDGEPPQSARGAIHTYVGRLRRSLTPHGLTIATRHDGYSVDLAGHSVDTQEFVELARSAGDTVDTGERLELYEKALALWHGPLLADVAEAPLRSRLESNLADLRLSCAERRAEIRLAMGHHDLVVSDLTLLAEQYPTREQLASLLMTALYRCGRQAEALRVYDLTRKVLEDEFGVEPGQGLQRLRTQIQRADPRLIRPDGPTFAVRVRDEWLPWSVGGHPALEFCNTYAGWGSPPSSRGDWLLGYSTLAVWAGHMDLADEGTVTRLIRLGREAPREAEAVLAAARTLRTNLYACLTKPDNPRAFSVVARFAEAAVKVSVFTRDDDGLGRWTVPPAAGLQLPLHVAAHSAAQLLSDPRRNTVCACRHAHCGWLFLDPSGRRRYCSVATCL